MSKRVYVKTPEEYSTIVAYLERSTYPDGLSKSQKQDLRKKSQNFQLIEKRLFFRSDTGPKQFFADFEDVAAMQSVKALHDLSHLGINTLFKRVQENFFGIKRKIVEHVCKNCIACTRNEPLKASDPIRFISASSPNERWQIDCINLLEFKTVKKFYLD